MSKDNKTRVKEPFIRVVKRDSISFGKSIVIRAAAIILALIVCAIIIFSITKMNPLSVYRSMFEGAFGTERRTWSTLRDTMFLLCISVALAPAFKMRFWNIGAEGQVLMGGIATAACMRYFSSLPSPLLFSIMIVSSMVISAIWGVIPAVFKSRWGSNETLFTLMMNYVAIQFTSYCVALWESPFGSNSVGIINRGSKAGWLPEILGQEYMLNVIVVMFITITMYIYLKYSKQGYEIAVVGESENTARYAGINVSRVFIRTMLISGAVCGLAGFLGVSGASHTISTSTAGGNGFTAIIVAWLGKFNPFVMILISLLLIFLDKGAIEIASIYNLNSYASEMITGILLFFILGSEFFISYKLIFTRGRKEEA
ncbi:MAG: ABC transporter permease [Clostridiaceae bacterium]